MRLAKARFTIGQLIVHKLFNYRGVIIDVDPIYLGSNTWYDQVALTRPPKDRPWYRVLVHNATHETYVAERNLMNDDSNEPVNHPSINDYFDTFDGSCYSASHGKN